MSSEDFKNWMVEYNKTNEILWESMEDAVAAYNKAKEIYHG